MVLSFLCGFLCLLASATATSAQGTEVAVPWGGTELRDLHREYYNIFKHGNRNAASHLWSSFLLRRAAHMSPAKLAFFFTGFCAVSGSPVGGGENQRYRLTLPQVGGGTRSGFMYYCCWPCACDTQDFIKVDTKTVQTSEGPRQFHFTVLGNPCSRPEQLDAPFWDPFDGRQTSISEQAQEVRCNNDGSLEGATLSDGGYIIINMFFDAPPDAVTQLIDQPQPGRMSEAGGVRYQDEADFADLCENRKNNGYNSGMGEIFRKVAAISPIDTLAPAKLASIDSTVEETNKTEL